MPWLSYESSASVILSDNVDKGVALISQTRTFNKNALVYLSEYRKPSSNPCLVSITVWFRKIQKNALLLKNHKNQSSCIGEFQ